ncbi:EAL domain-containing protein [Halofilum ochraceum]|uniref:EAL domain-containing protein n=1 Tax=Halofilum ochraceum TaxID=1611323 RepID=UPI0008D93FA1|nr:EAL domain-containing protein [Halofilum ochraceum]
MTESLNRLRVLILEDSEDDAHLNALALERHGFSVEWRRAENEQQLLGVLDGDIPDVILADHGMPRLDSGAALDLLHDRHQAIPFILVSGTIGEETVVELLHRGARDFVAKSHIDRLGASVERALREARGERERGAAERALRESERRYRSLVTATSDFLWWADADGRLYEIDPAWLEYTGYTRQEALGWGSFEAIHPDDRDAYLAAWHEAIHTGDVFRMEYRLRRHDNGYGWFLDRAAPVLDDMSRITEWVGASADISQRKDAETALRASEARYRTLFEDAPNGVLIMDREEIVDCNPRAPGIFDRHREDLVGLSLEAFSPENQPNGENSAQMARRLCEAAWNDGPQEFEWSILRGNGDPATLEVLLGPTDHQLHAILRDVTERRTFEAEMRKLSRAVQQAADAIIITDADRVIEYVNPAFERMTGYTGSEVIGQTPSLLGSDHNEPGVRERLKDALDAGHEFHGMLVNRRRSGELYYADMSIAPIRDDEGRVSHYIGTQYDVTEQLQKEHELTRLAHFDPVTELPNRTLIIDRLNHMLSQAPTVAGRLLVMHIDIDGFGFVNETWGHAGGDHVLKTIADRLSDAAGPAASVARIGNDGFVVALMTGPSEEGAETSTTRVQQALSKPLSFNDDELRVTGTLGVAYGPEDGHTGEELIAHAEMAMHRARERGREQLAFYTPAMHEEARQWLSAEGDLRRALEHTEFHLEYQPQIDLATGRISGLEALLRWTHPSHGPVSPGEFIPQLERSGLIVEVGEWVIHEACARIAEWDAVLTTGGTDLPRVAVNLSLVQFERRDLVEVVRHALQATGADPRCLELELTESSLAHNPEDAARTLHALRELGVTIALDDFGTGYSSLNYLKKFPIDKVKIDRVFIEGVTRDPGDAAILRAVLALARSRGMKTVAEGVETEAQVRFLQAQGCRHVQGFYFAPAITAPEVARMLADARRFDVTATDTEEQPMIIACSATPETHTAIQGALQHMPCRIVDVHDEEAALRALALNAPVAVVMADAGDGPAATELLQRVHDLYPAIRRVLIAPDPTGDAVQRAVNAAAVHRLLCGPVDADGMQREIGSVLEEYQTERAGRGEASLQIPNE